MSSIELLFAVDNFNQPAKAVDDDADALLLYNILFGRDDRVGFNIRRYKFKNIVDAVGEITTELSNHCAKYVPHIYIDNIEATTTTGENLVLYITIKNLTTDTSKNIYFNIDSTSAKMLVDVIS